MNLPTYNKSNAYLPFRGCKYMDRNNKQGKTTSHGNSANAICCIPIGNLQPKPGYPGFSGRPAYQNECACLTLDFRYKEFLLETLKIFGTLSANHNRDVRSIVDVISNKLDHIIK